MKKLILALALTAVAAYSYDRFPSDPNESITPGSLCPRADSYRYPEQIAYCERNVHSSLKDDIIREYDRRFGFEVAKMNRQDFKIDHYIPLCMGGSNSRDNLWPQHKSIYVKTDLIEERSCQLMAKGRLRQADAIEMIQHVKNHLEEADKVLADLNSKLRD